MNCSKVVIVGGAAGALIAYEILKERYHEVIFLEPFFQEENFPFKKEIASGKVEDNFGLLTEYDYFVATGDNYIRRSIIEKILSNTHTMPINCIHSKANISKYASLGYGNLILCGAAVNINAKIGDGCIVNTNAVVEHDNILEDYCQISPSTTLCGYVKIGSLSFISANSTIAPHVEIASRTVIGAGSVVLESIEEEQCLYAGIPAVRKKSYAGQHI